MATQEWMATQYDQASDTCLANRPNMRGSPTAHRTQPSLSPQTLTSCARQPDFRVRHKSFFSFQGLRCTSQDMRSEKHCKSSSFVRTTHESQIVGQSGQNTTSIESSKVMNLYPMLHLIQTISPSYTPLPGVMSSMTALALRISLILVVEFHVVCRCTICGAQTQKSLCHSLLTPTLTVVLL